MAAGFVFDRRRLKWKTRKAQKALDSAVIRAMQPYTPVAPSRYPGSGRMLRSIDNRTPGRITYRSGIAKREYYGVYFNDKKQRRLFRHRSPQQRLWFEIAKRQHFAEIRKAVTDEYY